MAIGDAMTAMYKLDESSGDASDSTGNGNTLTNNNTAAYGAGKLNNCLLNTTGTTKCLSRASSLGYTSNSQNISWNMWVNLSNYSNRTVFQVTDNSVSRVSVQVYAGTDTALHLVAGSSEVVSSGLSTSTWYMLTVTKTGTTYEMFINNVSAGTVAQATNSSYTGSFFVIGNGTNNGTSINSNQLLGGVDEFGVFPWSLSASDRAYLYGGGTPPSYPYSSGPGGKFLMFF